MQESHLEKLSNAYSHARRDLQLIGPMALLVFVGWLLRFRQVAHLRSKLLGHAELGLAHRGVLVGEHMF